VGRGRGRRGGVHDNQQKARRSELVADADRAPHGSEAQEFVVLTLYMYISTTEDGFKLRRDATAILLKLFHSGGLSPRGAGRMAGGQYVPPLSLAAAFHVGDTELVRLLLCETERVEGRRFHLDQSGIPIDFDHSGIPIDLDHSGIPIGLNHSGISGDLEHRLKYTGMPRCNEKLVASVVTWAHVLWR